MTPWWSNIKLNTDRRRKGARLYTFLYVFPLKPNRPEFKNFLSAWAKGKGGGKNKC